MIAISKGGKLTFYTDFDITFHPKIIKTKSINQQKNLKVIRNKFKHNRKLTSFECSLLIALPLFELNEREEDIVREMCNMIDSKKICFPSEELEGVIMGMHLNILEYIDENEQDDLKERINLAATQKGIIQTIKEKSFEDGKNKGFDDGRNKGIDEGKRQLVSNLLAVYPLEEVSKRLDMDKEEIIGILQE